jgi:hypothetical protein
MSRATTLRWMALAPMTVGFACVVAAYSFPYAAFGAMAFGFQTALFFWAASDIERKSDRGSTQP